jgi:hypothetical protein
MNGYKNWLAAKYSFCYGYWRKPGEVIEFDRYEGLRKTLSHCFMSKVKDIYRNKDNGAFDYFNYLNYQEYLNIKRHHLSNKLNKKL